MNDILGRNLILPLLLLGGSTLGIDAAWSQGAQHKQTDLEFVRNMVNRLDAMDQSMAETDKVIVRGWDADKKSSKSEQVRLGRQADSPASDPDAYGRVKVKLNALEAESVVLRRQLAAHEAIHVVQSGGSKQEKKAKKNRTAIQERIDRLEKDLAALNQEAKSLPGRQARQSRK